MWNWEKTITINLDSENLWGQIYLRTIKQSYFLIKGVILQPRDLRFGLYGIHGKVLFWSTKAKKSFLNFIWGIGHIGVCSAFCFSDWNLFAQFLPQFLFFLKKEEKGMKLFSCYMRLALVLFQHFANCSLVMKSILLSLSALILLVILFQLPIRYSKSQFF